MTAKRDTLFPSTSIGRTQGSRLIRTPSHETLAAHPLLSPSNSSSLAIPPSSPDSPKYVPYTPRQRVTATSATTETSTVASTASSQQQHQGDATSKLQLMSLKAAAQNVGIDTGTLGWAILEKLISENEHSLEWTDIYTAVTAGKATLLLPLEQASSNDKITAEFVKDHVVLSDGGARTNAPILTLSGLRGTLNGSTLTFRSSISPSSKQYHALFSTPRSLGTLPPLPIISPTSTYPSYTLPSFTSSLPLPPRPATPKAPSLPPRPSARTTPQPSRLSNPFASLFGKSSAPPTPSALPAPANTSPTPSINAPSELESPTTTTTVIEISAFTITHKINRTDLGKSLNRALRSDIKESCAGLAPWVTERVLDFVAPLYPIVKAPKSKMGKSRVTTQQRLQDTANGISSVRESNYVVSAPTESSEELAERFQDFCGLLEQDLRLGGTPYLGSHKRKEGEAEAEEKWVQRKVESEGRIREIMETVERTVCGLFYDRIFLQDSSDDASHDEALSGRVAALNMLDLGLEHLDVHVGDAGTELYTVVNACGETLSQLDAACRTPADKAAVMVAAHKIIVEGLSRLPPIRLKSEEESKEQKERMKEEQDTSKQPLFNVVSSDIPAVVSPTETTQEETKDTATDTKEPSKQKDNMPIDTKEPPDDEDNSIETEEPELTEPIGSQAIPIHILPDATPADPIPTTPSSPSPSPSPSPPNTNLPQSVLTIATPPIHSPTPVSGDILLPLIIFAVVKANPPHFVSHLLYTQRFRNQNVGGEESYCLINLMAVAEFLENVDLGALGLGGSDKVVSTASLTPIPINKSPMPESPLLTSMDGMPGSLRGRVEQQVDAIADSANKVITGVVDSFGILRSLTFLPGTTTNAIQEDGMTTSLNPVVPSSAASWNVVKPGLGMLRRETGFSIKGITSAVLPGRATPKNDGESGQQLVSVSRPGSIREPRGGGGDSDDDDDDDDDHGGEDEEGEGNDDEGSGSEEEESGEDEAETRSFVGAGGDTRSIRSFESMLKDRPRPKSRKSLSDRFAHISGMANISLTGSPSHSRQSTTRLAAPNGRFDTPSSSRPESPVLSLRLAPPVQRFVDCAEEDIKVSDVGELLREYKRLVEGIRGVGGFEE